MLTRARFVGALSFGVYNPSLCAGAGESFVFRDLHTFCSARVLIGCKRITCWCGSNDVRLGANGPICDFSCPVVK